MALKAVAADTKPDLLTESIPAERNTVGALLLAGYAVKVDILAIVRDDDFADPLCAATVKRVREMIRESMPVDAVTVAGYILRHGLVQDVNGLATWKRNTIGSELHTMISECPNPTSGSWYAGIVVEHSARRQAARFAQKLQGWASGASLEELRLAMWGEGRHVLDELARAEQVYG